MPLRITLKPFERLIINGASIRNGDRNASLMIETRCQFLRESELIHESEADTPCKKLCVTLQVIHLAENPDEAEGLLYQQAREIMQKMPGTAPIMADIQAAIVSQETYKAIKLGKELISFEKMALIQV